MSVRMPPAGVGLRVPKVTTHKQAIEPVNEITGDFGESTAKKAKDSFAVDVLRFGHEQ
jgi:hypothetical protein